ncbi:hypothetical protein EPUS_05957 [Endocarpon pusillum Z07020]|uniref:RRM domain-containing protein n=1 Tax=Endocarpon pusillum (strain Z07020 / HMAS-L-300199) TaxID=1263415 RepID=U1FX20_ENDPU|nr:uncharacterized protein EPUS_05957 [Endocarpon pusillum Z07020]ERF69412.1 hypothetical protein EPUS_05957 [Endocarpon pusillum Z07020]
MSEVSSTRLYLGNLPRTATKQDIEEHFNREGTGKITEVKLMNGFGFIEYEDALDARDIVPVAHRPQDLKDFARQSGLDVVYSETGRDRDGKGFVEFETAKDLSTAVEKLDNHEFKGTTVHCVSDIQEERPQRDMGYRSRTPPRRYGPPGFDEPYDRRGPPPRGYSPRGYPRERSPGRGRYDDYGRDYGRRSPPLPRGRLDDGYGHGPPPPRRAPYEHDPYDRRGPPPPGGYPDPYRSGDPYARPRSPLPRYGGGGGYGGYEDGAYPRRYW